MELDSESKITLEIVRFPLPTKICQKHKMATTRKKYTERTKEFMFPL